MASSNDLIKYVTQEVVRYLDTPKEARKPKNKVPLTYQWFGFMPLAIRMSTEKTKKQLKNTFQQMHKVYQTLKQKRHE